MTTEITTELKTHVVITFSGLNIYITQKQYDGIMQKSSEKNQRGVELWHNGKKMFVAFGDISSIPDLEMFYDNNPDKRPEPIRDDFKKYETFSDKLPVNGLPSLIKGITKFINEEKAKGNNPTKAIALLERWQNRAGKVQNGKYVPKYLTWQDKYYAEPLTLLDNRTKESILEFLNDSPKDKLLGMKGIITEHLEVKHAVCDCKEVGTCKPAGLLAAIMQALDKKEKVATK